MQIHHRTLSLPPATAVKRADSGGRASCSRQRSKTGLSTINMIRNAIVNRKGVTAMEYAVIAAGIVIAIAVAAETAGTLITNLFSTITSYLS
jgi:Flp pilus assembly pilin Flp